MKRFVFKLESLMRLRERQEEDCQKALASAILATQIARKRVEEIKEERGQVESAWKQRLHENSTDSETVRDFDAYLSALERRLRAAEKKVADAWSVEQMNRSRLANAVRKRRILENLKARHEQKHREASAKAEQAEMEEISAAGAEMRRAMGGSL